jgi:hypothetical protein
MNYELREFCSFVCLKVHLAVYEYAPSKEPYINYI